MVRVYVNDIPVDVDEGSTILDAVRKAGLDVPTLCKLGDLYREASCRLCLVELSTGRLVPACAYPASDGLRIYTNTPRVRKVRRIVLELLLATHKMKCWYCLRKGGDCILLLLTKEYGIEGIPVCAECPLYGEDCLIRKGYPCLGPLTIAGCGAPCLKKYALCIGCRGPVTRKDIIEEAIKFYLENGINLKEVMSLMKIFWSNIPAIDKIERLFMEKLTVR